jgi:thiamine-monophosphate kinase
MVKLKDIGELKFIKRIEGLIPSFRNKDVVVSLGDDCAVVKDGKSLILLSSDMSIENVHFLSDVFPPSAIGWKSMASAWSDIAGMGGEPCWALVSWSLPEYMTVHKAEAIFQGILKATEFVNGTIIGGDTTASNDNIIIDVTVIGKPVNDRYITRSGAKEGDIIAVTGTLGNSAAGLVALKQGLPECGLWRSHWYPIPRVEEGKWLCETGSVNAMIDISDGLIVDAGHIAEMSQVGINIHKQDIPASEELTNFCEKYNLNIDDFTLGGGEEYQLLVSIPQEKWEQISTEFNALFPCSITAIGQATHDGQDVRVDGTIPQIKGYEHFI